MRHSADAVSMHQTKHPTQQLYLPASESLEDIWCLTRGTGRPKEAVTRSWLTTYAVTQSSMICLLCSAYLVLGIPCA